MENLIINRALALRQECENNIFFFSNPFFPLIRLNPGVYKLKFTSSIERVTSKDDHEYIILTNNIILTQKLGKVSFFCENISVMLN